MDAGRKRIEYLRQDPRVSFTVMDPQDWVTHISVQGKVVEWQDDPDLADIDRIARHYTGQSYATRDRPRVTARIGIDRWHGWEGGSTWPPTG